MTDVRTVVFGSSEYEATIELRRTVLRRPLGLDFTPEQLALEASDVHLAVFANGGAIACLVLTPKDSTTLKRRQVAVRDDGQGKGIGRRLVEASERWAEKRGYARIILSARETAVPFYLRLGYRTEGEPFTEVGLPHRAMSKDLSVEPAG